jgi:hypothetical protein
LQHANDCAGEIRFGLRGEGAGDHARDESAALGAGRLFFVRSVPELTIAQIFD